MRHLSLLAYAWDRYYAGLSSEAGKGKIVPADLC